MNKKGASLLIENVIFIILNLVFITILVLFVYSKMSSTAILEEQYAKQIALVIDSAKPGMDISMNVQKLVDKAKKENWEGKIIIIEGNVVNVKLSENSLGYSYSFFNDVKIDTLFHYPDENKFSFKIN